MKILLILLLITNFSFAQNPNTLLAFEATSISDSSFLPENEIENFDYTINNTNSAVAQIKDQISKINYPSSMTKHCIEGEVIVEVSVSKTGKISDTKIIKSLFSEFDNIVVDAINEIGKIDYLGHNYQGGKRFRMPVNFSLR